MPKKTYESAHLGSTTDQAQSDSAWFPNQKQVGEYLDDSKVQPPKPDTSLPLLRGMPRGISMVGAAAINHQPNRSE